MTIEQATQLVGFLAKYNKHFADVVAFLNLKLQKVFADDLIWLHDSLQDEQKFSMFGVSLESKRLELLEEIGYPDYPSSKLLEVMPEESKGRFKLECTGIENSIDKIKSLNAEIIETIEKKLDAADEQLEAQGISSKTFYRAKGEKVRLGNPEDEFLGNM